LYIEIFFLSYLAKDRTIIPEVALGQAFQQVLNPPPSDLEAVILTIIR
jgi:hypothetical protein